MKRIIALLALCPALAVAMTWESASFTGQQPEGSYTRCFYATDDGFRFSIVTRDTICPTYVQVNPETGQVRK